ncbi:hypothetical protein GCM10009678_74000 [Actinomadura kijaniata]
MTRAPGRRRSIGIAAQQDLGDRDADQLGIAQRPGPPTRRFNYSKDPSAAARARRVYASRHGLDELCQGAHRAWSMRVAEVLNCWIGDWSGPRRLV